MKWIVVLFLTLFADDGINKIARINEYKKEGNQAFKAEDYKKAAEKYRYLYDTLRVKEDPIVLNLGHSYYHLKDTANAKSFYGILTASKDEHYRSVAHQQLGVISFDSKKYALALNHFKNALKADPGNEEARYNYELTKRIQELIEEQNKQNKKDQEPSEYAKELKKQADELISNNQFAEAYKLMERGLAVDETVSSYEEFIQKLKDVYDVEQAR